jgi:hypothetical protein
MLLNCSDVNVELNDRSFFETSLGTMELFEFLVFGLV